MRRKEIYLEGKAGRSHREAFACGRRRHNARVRVFPFYLFGERIKLLGDAVKGPAMFTGVN